MNTKEIGAKIRRLRKEKGLSQSELAEGVCSFSYISQIERGTFTGVPTADILSGIAMKLGISLRDLLEEIDGQEFENDMLIDVVKVLLHREEYTFAIDLIHELQSRYDLLQHQRADMILCHAESLTKIGEPAEAVELLTNFLIELESKQSTDQHLLAQVSNALGNAYHSMNDMITAYSHFVRAYQICSSFPTEDLLSAKISYNLGYTCQALRMDAQSKMHLENAMKFFESLGDRKRLAHSLYSLGITLKNLEQMERAGEYIKRSLALYEAESISRMAQLARSQFAFYVLAGQDQEQAISEMRKSLDEYEQLGDVIFWVYVSARIAYLYLEGGEVGEAQQVLEAALPKVEDQIDPHYAYFYRVYARYLTECNQIDEALEYIFKSAEMFGASGMRKEQAASLRQAITIYQLQGSVDEALRVAMTVNEILETSLDFLLLT